MKEKVKSSQSSTPPREDPSGFAPTHGSPGARVRFTGLVRLFWPFLLGLFAAGYLVSSALPAPAMSSWTAGMALLGLAATGWGFHARAVQRFGDFLKGARGEEMVARELSLLPERFEVFHGVRNPDGGGDLDHVVLGPGGIAVVETKHWSGPVSWIDGELRAGGERPSRSPIAQVRRASSDLARHLQQRGFRSVDVHPIVCFAGNAFEAEVAASDELFLCNSRSLCAVLHKVIGQASTDQSLENGISRELADLAGG